MLHGKKEKKREDEEQGEHKGGKKTWKKINLGFSSKSTKTPMGAELGFIQMKTQNRFSPTNALVGAGSHCPQDTTYMSWDM